MNSKNSNNNIPSKAVLERRARQANLDLAFLGKTIVKVSLNCMGSIGFEFSDGTFADLYTVPGDCGVKLAIDTDD